jgi:hypothetical protein
VLACGDDCSAGMVSPRCSRFARASSQRPPPRRPTLSDRAGRVGYDGERVETGFASLDGDATRGGLPFGKIVVLGAAPCGSKTMIALAWAHSWPRQECRSSTCRLTAAPRT